MKVTIIQNYDLLKLEEAINTAVGSWPNLSQARVTITPVITGTFTNFHDNSQQHEVSFVATIEQNGFLSEDEARQRYGK